MISMPRICGRCRAPDGELIALTKKKWALAIPYRGGYMADVGGWVNRRTGTRSGVSVDPRKEHIRWLIVSVGENGVCQFCERMVKNDKTTADLPLK
jgi:hypothetical protein